MPRIRRVVKGLLAGATALSGYIAVRPATAAEITASKSPEEPYALVLIEGPIEDGDDRRFAEAVKPFVGTPSMVILHSPGGSGPAALGIGGQIHVAFFATIVLEGQACRGACALIWLAGVQRHMTDTSTIVLAPPGASDQGEEGADGRVLEEYLRSLELPEAAIHYAFDIPAGDERPITPGIARGLDLPVWVYRDGRIIRPETPAKMRR